MTITSHQKARIEKLMSRFIEDNKLSHYYGSIEYTEEEKTDDCEEVIASIYMEHKRKEFLITVHINRIANLDMLKETILHELTHLFFYEVDEFYRFLEEDTENVVLKMACQKMYESITYKTTEIFKDRYL